MLVVLLPGKLALVATGHAIALIPWVLTPALRPDVTTAGLVDPPTRGISAITPRRDPHPSAATLIDRLAATSPARPVPNAHRSDEQGVRAAPTAGRWPIRCCNMKDALVALYLRPLQRFDGL